MDGQRKRNGYNRWAMKCLSVSWKIVWFLVGIEFPNFHNNNNNNNTDNNNSMSENTSDEQTRAYSTPLSHYIRSNKHTHTHWCKKQLIMTFKGDNLPFQSLTTLRPLPLPLPLISSTTPTQAISFWLTLRFEAFLSTSVWHKTAVKEER